MLSNRDHHTVLMEFLQRLTSGRQHPTAAIDLAVARGSLVIEAAAYVFMALASTGSLFTTFAVVSTLGIAFTPAINTVASAVYTQQGGKELGKLFGALGVVQTIWCVSLYCIAGCIVGRGGADLAWALVVRWSWARSSSA